MAPTSGVKSPIGEGNQSGTSLYIVFLSDAPGSGGVSQRASALLGSLGSSGKPSFLYEQLGGFAVELTAEQAKRLRALGGVQSVEANQAVFLQTPSQGLVLTDAPILGASSNTTLINPAALTSYGNLSGSTGETLPWGVRAVWQGYDVSKAGNAGAGTIAFVIDSGVSATTGDLTLNSAWSKSWISGEGSFTDGNGHGTHVSHTIAALANGKGVIGVAPGATVVSLKVFDTNGGSATNATIIDAINYAVSTITANSLNKQKLVINMSLGGGASSSLETAVKNAANQGIRFAIAAGNSGADADGYSPANAGENPNVFTVSAVDSTYKMASFSNWDQVSLADSVDDVDVAAPGVSVLSYYKGDVLSYLSGTSMAAPHVAGLLLMGGVKPGDPVTPYYSGTADPFAWNATSLPSQGSGSPTYVLSGAAAVNEGSTQAITITTTNVATGTALYWRLSGPSITSADLSTGSLTGTATVNSGAASASISLNNDAATEGQETALFSLFSDSGRTNPVGSFSFTINDTSVSPTSGTTKWGTVGSDAITGTNGNDQLAGVSAPPSNTSTNLGRGQIDTLTGLLGSDKFLLGDATRGVYYNDGSSLSSGSSDYALIADFKGIEGDKIQLASGRTYFTQASSYSGAMSTFVYWDSNNNGIFGSSDELIGIVKGVGSMVSSDFIFG